jgi:hypothetical protein
MKIKTINAVLTKKFDEFVITIDDDVLRHDVKNNSIITGGAIASLLLRESVNDYDIYFTSNDLAYRVANYYVQRFNKTNNPTRPVSVRKDDDGRVRIYARSAGVISENAKGVYEYFDTLKDMEDSKIVDYSKDSELSIVNNADTKPRYRPVFMSMNAITLSDKVQLIVRFAGDPDEIHKNYDFVHCTNYWTSKDHKLVLRQEALESILARELLYVGSLYPVCSVIRTRKFINRGWTINAGQYLKMCMQISQLDLTDLNVLEDQLVGVDTSFFLDLIDKLREADPNKVNYAYLMTIIDRIF